MNPTPEPAEERCAARNEFGRCGYPAGGHKRHRSKTAFGEMEWETPGPSVSGQPAPTLDEQIKASRLSEREPTTPDGEQR